MVRRRLRDMVKKYKIYYTLSYEQLEDYKKRFGCNMKILQKCGTLVNDEYIARPINSPIRIIYAWKALYESVESIDGYCRDFKGS